MNSAPKKPGRPPKKPTPPTQRITATLAAAARTDPRSRAILARATSDIVSLARQQANRAILTLQNALEATTERGAPDWKARIRAAEVILDRGFGRAPQVTVQAARLDDDTLRRAVEAIAAKRGVVVDAQLVPSQSKAPPTPLTGGYEPMTPPRCDEKEPPQSHISPTPEKKE